MNREAMRRERLAARSSSSHSNKAVAFALLAVFFAVVSIVLRACGGHKREPAVDREAQWSVQQMQRTCVVSPEKAAFEEAVK